MGNENTQVATRQPGKVNVVKEVKNILAQDNVKQRFRDVLGKKAPQYMASIVNVISATPALKQCEPNSIMGAAFVAASFDLPIDSKARINDGWKSEELMEAVKNYVSKVARERTEQQYIKHAKTFFSDSTPFIDFLSTSNPETLSPALSEDDDNPYGIWGGR